MNRKSIYWLTNDLRLDDNRALLQSADSADELAIIYIIDPGWFKKNRYQAISMGAHRLSFLGQSLIDLDSQFSRYNQSLQLFYGTPYTILASLIENAGVTELLRSETADYNLNRQWQCLVNEYPEIQFSTCTTHTLFDRMQLPFELDQLPPSFSGFRKRVETLPITATVAKPAKLPPVLKLPGVMRNLLDSFETFTNSKFSGGSSHATAHLANYFKYEEPHRYFELRNSLDGWENSTKFSPWLANGCLSPRQIVTTLSEYESNTIKNKSTYWIFFELLWREYFQWYAHKHGKRLFRFSGIKQQSPLTSFYPERFKKWCGGNTPYAIVNACMNELNSTGYMSNRGRQIAASCLVNELRLDWRFGAAYFEQQLIDYDVASNWGNWQYLAGVGADPKKTRHFNLDKQAKLYDPTGDYISRWTQDRQLTPLDSVDAADWPVN